MKIKRIMLVTFMLLAVLTIGAVSAADDVSSGNLTVADDDVSDGLTVSEDEDIRANDDKYEDSYIYVYEDEEICIDTSDEDEYEEDYLIAEIYLPENSEGSFRVYNGNVLVSSMNFEEEDEDDTWEIDDGDLVGYILLKNFDLNKVNDGDKLSFQFWELVNGNYKVVESLTQEYTVILTDTTMILTSGDGEMSGLDGDIKVNKIDTSKPDENFTYVYVNAKDGSFVITVDDIEGDELEIFKENLNTTDRNYTLIEDENGDKWYRFGFSYNDINDFIQSAYEESFIDLLNDDDLVDTDGKGITFYLNENDEEESEITSLTMSYTISKGIISFINEDEDLPVDVEYYLDSEIVMKDGWQDERVLTFTVQKGITGRIVIYLNDDKTPVFNKTLDDLVPDEIDEEAESDDYTITIRNLTITEEGNYTIRDYFYNDNGEIIYQYDEDFLEILKLVPSQVITDGNATFDFNQKTVLSNSSDIVLTIGNVTDSGDDEIVIYVDDSKTPIIIKLSTCDQDVDGNYTVPANKLGNLDAGRHTLNVTCKGFNAIGNISLKSNLVIEFPENYEVYTTFDDAFVFFSLDDEEIEGKDVGGNVNVTIFNDNGSINTTIEKEFGRLIYDNYEEAYVIKYNDLGVELNGKHLVVVRYFGGNKAGIQKEANVTFKEFDPKDYGASIKESVRNVNDYVITFTDIPLNDNVIVKIDGNNSIRFKSEEIRFNESINVYYISFSKLGLSDGTHSIEVYVETVEENIILASGNVYVDVVPNIDPALTVSADNITEGADAVIVITTNNTFSGVVSVKIANVTYNVTVTNGAGNYSVSGLAAGTYNVTAIFKGNAFFNESTKNTTFVVNPKVATTISAPAVTTTYATSKNIVVTLKDANGNPLVEKEVAITFNGASKTLKTNAKGQVSYAIGSKLAPKKYTAAFKFAGDSAYLASSGTVKVTVKKAKVKMTAKKKTFKAKKKTKKYTIVLKTDKGKALKKVKVTIKIKGKKYTAKTNKKGKATFKLKKLTKKGKYKAKITFAGNKYYNKLTKKVTIKVKK